MYNQCCGSGSKWIRIDYGWLVRNQQKKKKGRSFMF